MAKGWITQGIGPPGSVEDWLLFGLGEDDDPGGDEEGTFFDGLYSGLFLNSTPFSEAVGDWFATAENIPQPSELLEQSLPTVIPWYATEDFVYERRDGLYIFYRFSDLSMVFQIVANSLVDEVAVPHTIVADEVIKIAVIWNANTLGLSVNNSAIKTVSRTNLVVNIPGTTPLDIGSMSGTYQLEGGISPIYVFNSESLSQADVQYLNDLNRKPDIEEDNISPRRRALWVT